MISEQDLEGRGFLEETREQGRGRRQADKKVARIVALRREPPESSRESLGASLAWDIREGSPKK